MQLYFYPNIWISKIDIKNYYYHKKGDEDCCYADCQNKFERNTLFPSSIINLLLFVETRNFQGYC